MFNPEWVPGAFMSTLGNICYALTDPPLNALKKIVPPVRFGNISLDLGMIILLVIVGLLQRLVVAFMLS
nr:YggT family protein [Boudabousia tangfeifanii]